MALPDSIETDASAIGGVMLGIFAGVILGSLISSIGVYETIFKIAIESSKEAE